MKTNFAKGDLSRSRNRGSEFQIKMEGSHAKIVIRPSRQNPLSKYMKKSLVKIEEVVFDPLWNQTVHFIHC
jgi:hypothetical protein